MNENKEVKTIEEDNNHSLLEMLILIVFVVSILGSGLKIYKGIESIKPMEWGPCGIGGMTEQERKECLAHEEVKKQNAEEATIFLEENHSTFMLVGLICLVSSVYMLVRVKQFKLKKEYLIFGVFSIIASVILIL